MRIFVAGIATEVNTFSPIFIGTEAFEDSLLARPGQHPETPTLCTAPLTEARKRAAAGEFELIEGTTAWADPGGLVNRKTYETLRDEILDQLRLRLDNTDEAERAATIDQLTQIAVLRMREVLS